MFNLKKEIFYLLGLSILACILVIDFWSVSTQPQTFDGWAHLVTFDSFAQSIRAGSLPVSWTDSVAHYGYPLGQIAHQTTNYLGALLFMLTDNVTIAYNLLLTLTLVATAIMMYLFLRLFAEPLPAFAGAALFNVAPYRFLNIYVRGALPELIAPFFILLTLYGLGVFFLHRQKRSLILCTAGMAGLTFTHPMVLLLAAPLIGALLTYFFWQQRFVLREYMSVSFFLIVGVLIGGYYLFPLVGEIKYFYQGEASNEISQAQFLDFDAVYLERWQYFDPTTTGIRENRFQLGVLEAVILVATVFIVFFKKKFLKNYQLAAVLLTLFFGTFFMATTLSKPLYDTLPLLSGIQFPWRWLSILQFIPPMLLALLLANTRFAKLILVLVFVYIAIVRIPETYAKNFTYYPPERYATTSMNIHSTSMNTIWSGETTEYPPKVTQAELIAGKGSILMVEYSPTRRVYQVRAETPVRIAEYTFYFPGWKVFANDVELPIEFQDHEYRGVITYQLDQGEYIVKVQYHDTKIRYIGKVISVLGLIVLMASVVIIYKRPDLVLKREK